ncbi:MAG: rhodanese-like domain-containing protein [Proteobacteria bacterium]|nr:rhodanese-like domain-containing protein [Pseudomonadota bacterium]
MKGALTIIIFFVLLKFNLYAQIVIPDREILKNSFIIDMRPKEQFKKGHISGSVNINIDDLKTVIQSGGIAEFHNLCVILGIMPNKANYIISANDSDGIFNAMILAGLLNYIGIKEAFIVKVDYKDLINAGFPETDKGAKLVYSDWAINYAFNFLTPDTYRRLEKQKNVQVISLNGKLEKGKNVNIVNSKIFFENGILKTCEEIDKIIFTGKRKDKKDIILKGNDILTLFGVKYLLSKVCGYGNVMVFKEGD